MTTKPAGVAEQGTPSEGDKKQEPDGDRRAPLETDGRRGKIEGSADDERKAPPSAGAEEYRSEMDGERQHTQEASLGEKTPKFANGGDKKEDIGSGEEKTLENATEGETRHESEGSGDNKQNTANEGRKIQKSKSALGGNDRGKDLTPSWSPKTKGNKSEDKDPAAKQVKGGQGRPGTAGDEKKVVHQVTIRYRSQ